MLLFLAPLVLRAQVEARQATPEEAAKMERGVTAQANVEIPNPMLLKVPIRTHEGANFFRPLDELVAAQRNKHATVEKENPNRPGEMMRVAAPAMGGNFVSTETARFSCDRTSVALVRVQIGKLKKKPSVVPLVASAMLKSEWFRQDVDVTIALLDGEGRKLASRTWDDETIGDNSPVAFSGKTKTLELETSLPAAVYERLSASSKPATLSIFVEVQGESGDEDDD